MEVPSLEAASRRGSDQLRRLGRAALEASARAVGGESVRLRAMALTFLSSFALVPALVVAFAVVQAFTGTERLADQVNDLVLDNLAVGARTTVACYLDRFVGNAHLASTGLVGGALLVYSMVSLFSNVDGAINDLWGIRRRRRLRDQVVTYWIGLTVGPILLAGSVYLGHLARGWLAATGSGALALAGGLLSCLFLSGLYWLVPNTRVRRGPALAAGFVAGIVWEVAKWGYAVAATRFFRYNAIYGSVAAIPTFLLWLYVSWTIVLFGARLAFVAQNAPALWHGGPIAEHPTTRESLAGRLLLEIGLAFQAGGGEASAPEASDLARRLRIQAEDVSDVLEALSDAGLVRSLAGGGLAPARPLSAISLLDVRGAVIGPPPRRPRDEDVALDRVLRAVDGERAGRLQAVTLEALCLEERASRDRGSRPSGGMAVPAGDPVRTPRG